MICILFAMNKEAAPLLKEVEVLGEERFGCAELYRCKRGDREFYVGISGVGKAFAAAALSSFATAHSEIDAFINVGVGGSKHPEKAPILSAVIASDLVEHDLDTSAVGDPVGLISGINIVEIPTDPKLNEKVAEACKAVDVPCAYGRISSGDVFFAPEDPGLKKVMERFDPLSVDMESAPFGQIAYAFGLPYAALRVITDGFHPETEYIQNVSKACEILAKILLALLDR